MVARYTASSATGARDLTNTCSGFIPLASHRDSAYSRCTAAYCDSMSRCAPRLVGVVANWIVGMRRWLGTLESGLENWSHIAILCSAQLRRRGVTRTSRTARPLKQQLVW